MSPPASSGKQKESGLARLLGSGTSGILELFIFHPVDTIAKRLMTNQQKVFVPGAPLSQSFNNLGEAIFKDKHSATFFRKYTSLFPGLGYAGGYKVLQRIYKYGGQPYVKDYINKNHKDAFYKLFGEKSGKTIIHATAGSLIGIGEVALLPLDVLKIKRQTNPDTLKNRNIFKIFWDEGFGLYRGGLWTAARNAPGSFALFGGSAFVKEYLFGLKDYSKATFLQNFCASIGGAIASISVAQPLDVVKTRIQNRPFDSPETGTQIIRKMILKEGSNLKLKRKKFFFFEAFVKEYLFGLKDYSKATFLQNFCASIGGAIASISVAQPLDVVKTRIQNRPFDSPETGTQIIRKMILKEGSNLKLKRKKFFFFEGVTPKLIVVGPKLVFSFTIAQQLIPILNNFFVSKGIVKPNPL
ncbi:14093_t:CDS:2 [Entrophospora sp. SA101]|nr:14093_t:CDS:2 [Entrophospora sp. SA101]